MIFSIFFPLLVGFIGVLQNTINKKIGDTWGLPITLVWNNIIVLAISVLCYLGCKYLNLARFSPLFKTGIENIQNISPLHFLPGIMGFLIVFTIPLAVSRSGALRVFLLVVVAQIITSILWDFSVEKIPLSGVRAAGALLTLVGAYLATR